MPLHTIIVNIDTDRRKVHDLAADIERKLRGDLHDATRSISIVDERGDETFVYRRKALAASRAPGGR